MPSTVELDEGDGRGAERATGISRAKIADISVHRALFDKQVRRDMLIPSGQINCACPGTSGNNIDAVGRSCGLVLHQHPVSCHQCHAVDGHGARERSDVRGRCGLDRSLGIKPLNGEIDVILGRSVLGSCRVCKTSDALAVEVHSSGRRRQLVQPVGAHPGIGEVEVGAFRDVAGGERDGTAPTSNRSHRERDRDVAGGRDPALGIDRKLPDLRRRTIRASGDAAIRQGRCNCRIGSAIE